MKNNCEITEGSLLFEKKNSGMGAYYKYPLLVFLGLAILVEIIKAKYSYDISQVRLVNWIFLGSVGFIIVFLIVDTLKFIDGIRNGFEDETFKCYYFSDKLVFYRISNHLDNFYTKGKTTNQLMEELNDLLKKKNEDDEIEIEAIEEAIEISKNRRKPHKFEYQFEYFELFKSIDGGIECVSWIDAKNENDNRSFYRFLPLTKEYKKCQNQIVDFLNKKIREAKTNAPNF
jgi:hypothetical protein